MIYLISFIGQFIGYLIAKLAKEEIKPGKIYFNLLKNILLLIIIGFSIYYQFNIFYLISGLILGLIIKKEYFYFGIIANNLLFSSLIFIYGLPYGTLNNNLKKIIYNIPLFLITLIINFCLLGMLKRKLFFFENLRSSFTFFLLICCQI